jgi:L-aspartate oxidase
VVIATGGIGGLYVHSTNPAGSFGQGLALAARAGAVMADLEFVQFHPTALDSNASPLKLISEAVRGEGAIIVDETGRRFMADQPGAELAPRDVVARAIWHHQVAGHRVFLDARDALGSKFLQRFPSLTAICREADVDPVNGLIPIRPAQHYHMGGIAVNLDGRSSVEGLWACGEAAATGLHGANRLASNSLLEAVVCARFVAESIASSSASLSLRRLPAEEIAPVPSNPGPVRTILSRAAGVLRDEDGLRQGAAALLPMALSGDGTSDPALVALMIVVAALRREESRGAHSRTDFPTTEPRLAQRSLLRLDEATEIAQAATLALVA